ncbi:MAG: DNA/RNA non-specific endonuclease [Tatlockia sp.]|nr:DNA/RNA non-specific endonuclease [Tatlockia sp.]
MLTKIELFLTSLNNKAADYQLDSKTLLQINALYTMSTKENQDYLVKNLGKRLSIDPEDLGIRLDFLSETPDSQTHNSSLELICAAQRKAEDEKIEHFKVKAIKQVPILVQVEATRCNWLELIRRFEKKEHKYITRPFILVSFSTILKISLEQLENDTLRKQSKREVKIEISPSHTPHLKIANFKKKEGGENPLILNASSSEESKLHSPLRKTGVRITELSPVVPERGYQEVYATPGKTKVRPFFSNDCGTLFKPLTPYGTKTEQGMVNTTKSQRFFIEKKVPRINFDRPDTISFTATLEKLKNRQGTKRRLGQKQLMGASCCDVFKAHGSEELITINGRDYHWSHLIAYFLGGKHTEEEIIPGTAASNYNTLELVENFIALQLTEQGIDSVDIQVQPCYSNDSLIPDELIFHLSWHTPGSNVSCFEKIHINPRSYQRVTGSMHKSVELMRESNKSLKRACIDRDEQKTETSIQELKPKF